jgi:hypothetical protein
MMAGTRESIGPLRNDARGEETAFACVNAVAPALKKHTQKKMHAMS